MTPQEEKYLGLSQKFEINKRQIRQIEGEYDFLIERIQDSYAQDLAKDMSAIADDPKAKQIFPLKTLSKIKEVIKEAEDDIVLDRDKLVDQLKEMNKELQKLHFDQVDNFKEMNELIQNEEVGELGDDVLFRAQHEDAVDESRESYLGMVDMLSGQYETFDDLR